MPGPATPRWRRSAAARPMAPAPSPRPTDRAGQAPTSSRARATRAATSPRSPPSSSAAAGPPEPVARLRIVGPVIPFGRANVDTDLIIPSRYLSTVTRNGLGAGAFEPLRGQPGNPFD